MTNQQSIDKLQSLSLWLDKDSALYQAIVMAISALQAQDEEQREEPLYCDRDICLRNDYNGIGCEDCEVTKSQQQAKHGDGLDEAIRRLENISEYQSAEAERWDHSFDDYSGVKRDEYLKWSDEHRQLASWLKELKRLRAQEPCEDAVSRESILSILRENYRRLGLTDKAFMELCSLMKSEPSVTPKLSECEDCVSRDSVKFLLCKETCHPGAFCPDGFCREICEKVDALPSATPKQRMGEWIPIDKKSHPDTPERVQVQLDNGWIITAYYEEQENEWLSVPDFGEPIQDRWIEAWKPMPEPYKEDTNVDVKS